MIIRTFKQAEKFLALHIPKTTETTFPGELGLKRAKDFLRLLGNPQEKLKIIHVAGTSGKGSTCYLISLLLASQGFKVGFHQSPHLTDVRERFQINGKIISKKEFVNYLNKIIPFIDGSNTYFEILVGLAFYIFADKNVDYAVMETGLGGWYDGTNVVSRQDKLSVLTKIGLDHTTILGKTIEKIALQKAMIINKNSQAISTDQDPRAEKVVREVAEEKMAKIMFVDVGNAYMRSVRRGRVSRPDVLNQLKLIGDYQKQNAGLALAAVNYLSQRDGFEIDKEKVGMVFKTAHFPGRFDIKKINGKTVIFDGAHNSQKMEAFISSLVKKYPNKKFNFLLAFKKGKDFKEMLEILSTKADLIVLTSFFTENQDMINESEDPTDIIVGVDPRVDPELDIKIIPNLKNAWEEILEKNEPIVVAGSLYLVGEVFRLIKNK
ncbi:MAG: Mur ligase family protein [Patescibacteria group bacterium]|jgi:dihydrofolate synthase/folylpolyglutamate synthase